MTKKKKIIIGIIIGIVLLGIAVFVGIYVVRMRWLNNSNNLSDVDDSNKITDGECGNLSNVDDSNKIIDIECDYKHVSLPKKYTEIGEFNNGLAKVKENIGDKEEYVLLNKDGIEIMGKHQDIKVLKDNIFIKDNNKWKIFDLKGKQLNSNEYDDIEYRYEWWGEIFRVTFNGKQGILNKEGKEIVRCIYDDIEVDVNQNVKVKKDGKYGIKDKNGRDLIPCIYDNIGLEKIGIWFYKISLNGKYGLNNIDNGKAIFNCEYEEIKYCKGKIKVKKNGKYGISSNSGKEIIPCKYEEVIVIGENIYAVKSRGGWQLLNKDNKLIDNNIYEEIKEYIEHDWYEPSHNIVTYLKLNGKIGLISEDLNLNVPCKYLKYGYNDKIYIDSYNYIIVNNNSKVGLIDKKGNIILSFKYDEIKDKVFLEDSDREIFIFKLDNKYGLVEKGDNIILPNIYDNLESIYGEASIYKYILKPEKVSNNLYAKTNNNIGIIDIFGNEIVPIKYDSMCWVNSFNYRTSYKVYEVKLDNKIGLVKGDGELIFLVDGEKINWFDEKNEETFFSSCFRVYNKGKWGMVNESGNWVIPCKYKTIEVANFLNEDAFYYYILDEENIGIEDRIYYFVSDGKNIGIANSKGKIIIPVEYDEIEYSDKCIVSKNNKKGVINLSGKIEVPVEYDEISNILLPFEYFENPSSAGGYKMKNNGQEGILKIDGTVLIPPEYDSIDVDICSEYKYIYIVEKQSYKGAINKNGKMILPCEYDAIHYNEGIITAQNENGCYIIEYK